MSSSSSSTSTSSSSLFESKLNSLLLASHSDDPFNLRNRKRSEAEVLKYVESNSNGEEDNSQDDRNNANNNISDIPVIMDKDKENKKIFSNSQSITSQSEKPIRSQSIKTNQRKPFQSAEITSPSTSTETNNQISIMEMESSLPIVSSPPSSTSLPSYLLPYSSFFPSPPSSPSLPSITDYLSTHHILSLQEISTLTNISTSTYRDMMGVLGVVEKRVFALDTEDNVNENNKYKELIGQFFTNNYMNNNSNTPLIISSRDLSIHCIVTLLLSSSLSTIPSTNTNPLLHKSIVDTLTSLLHLSRYGQISSTVIQSITSHSIEIERIVGNNGQYDKKVMDGVFGCWSEGMGRAVGADRVVMGIGKNIQNYREMKFNNNKDNGLSYHQLCTIYLTFITDYLPLSHSFDTLDLPMILQYIIKDNLLVAYPNDKNTHGEDKDRKMVRDGIYKLLYKIGKYYDSKYQIQSNNTIGESKDNTSTLPLLSFFTIMKKLLPHWSSSLHTKESTGMVEEFSKYIQRETAKEVVTTSSSASAPTTLTPMTSLCRNPSFLSSFPLSPPLLSSLLPITPISTLISSTLLTTASSADRKSRGEALGRIGEILKEKEKERERVGMENININNNESNDTTREYDNDLCISELYNILLSRMNDPNKLLVLKSLQIINIIGGMIVREINIIPSSLSTIPTARGNSHVGVISDGYKQWESKFLPSLFTVLNDSKMNIRQEIMKILLIMMEYHQTVSAASLLSFGKYLPLHLLLTSSSSSSSSSFSSSSSSSSTSTLFTFGRVDFLSLLLRIITSLSLIYSSPISSSPSPLPPPKEYFLYLKEIYRVVSDNLLDRSSDIRCISEDIYKFLGEEMSVRRGKEITWELWREEEWGGKKVMEQKMLREMTMQYHGYYLGSGNGEKEKEKEKEKVVVVNQSKEKEKEKEREKEREKEKDKFSPFTISSLPPPAPPVVLTKKDKNPSSSSNTHGRSNSITTAINNNNNKDNGMVSSKDDGSNNGISAGTGKKLSLSSTQPLPLASKGGVKEKEIKEKRNVSSSSNSSSSSAASTSLSSTSTLPSSSSSSSSTPTSTSTSSSSLLQLLDFPSIFHRFLTLPSSSSPSSLVDETFLSPLISTHFHSFYAQMSYHSDLDKRYQFIEMVVGEWVKPSSTSSSISSLPSSSSVVNNSLSSLLSIMDIFILYVTSQSPSLLSSPSYAMKFMNLLSKAIRRMTNDREMEKEMKRYNSHNQNTTQNTPPPTIKEVIEFYLDHFLFPTLFSHTLTLSSSSPSSPKLLLDVKNLLRLTYSLLNVSTHHHTDRVERWLRMMKMTMGRQGVRKCVGEMGNYMMEMGRLQWWGGMMGEWESRKKSNIDNGTTNGIDLLYSLLSSFYSPLLSTSPSLFSSFYYDIHTTLFPTLSSSDFITTLFSSLEGVKEGDKVKGRGVMEEKEREREKKKGSNVSNKGGKGKGSVKEKEKDKDNKEGKSMKEKDPKNALSSKSTVNTISLPLPPPTPLRSSSSSSSLPPSTPSHSLTPSLSRRRSSIPTFTFSTLISSYQSLSSTPLLSSSSLNPSVVNGEYAAKIQLIDDFTTLFSTTGTKYVDMEMEDIVRMLGKEMKNEIQFMETVQKKDHSDSGMISNSMKVFDGICNFTLLLCGDHSLMSTIPIHFLREISLLIIMDIPLITLSFQGDHPSKHDIQQKILNVLNHLLYCYPHFHAIFHLILTILAMNIQHYTSSPTATNTTSTSLPIHMDSFIFISSLIRSLSEALLQHRSNEDDRLTAASDGADGSLPPHYFSGPLFRSDLIEPFLYEIHSMYAKIHNYNYTSLSSIPPSDFLTRTICDAVYVVWEMERETCREVMREIRRGKGKGEEEGEGDILSILDIFLMGMDEEMDGEIREKEKENESDQNNNNENENHEEEQKVSEEEEEVENNSDEKDQNKNVMNDEDTTNLKVERRRLTGILSRQLYDNLISQDNEDNEDHNQSHKEENTHTSMDIHRDNDGDITHESSFQKDLNAEIKREPIKESENMKYHYSEIMMNKQQNNDEMSSGRYQHTIKDKSVVVSDGVKSDGSPDNYYASLFQQIQSQSQSQSASITQQGNTETNTVSVVTTITTSSTPSLMETLQAMKKERMAAEAEKEKEKEKEREKEQSGANQNNPYGNGNGISFSSSLPSSSGLPLSSTSPSLPSHDSSSVPSFSSSLTSTTLSLSSSLTLSSLPTLSSASSSTSSSTTSSLQSLRAKLTQLNQSRKK